MSEDPSANPVWRWTFEPSVEAELRGVLDDWDRLEELPGARVLKSNASRTVISLPASRSRRSLIIKRYQVRSTKERIKYLMLPSRAQAEWKAIEHLARNDVRVPRALAVGEAHKSGFLRAAGLIMETVTDAMPLPLFLEGATHENTEQVLGLVGREIARLHDAGCDHTDLHGGNVLVHRAGDTVTLIDHHVAKTLAFVPEFRRLANLALLVHSLRGSVEYSAMLALLRGYDEGRSAPQWDSLSAVFEDLEERARKIEDRRLRSRGRRCWLNSSDFVREVRGERTIYRRREVDVATLEDVFSTDARFDPILKQRPGYLVGVANIAVAGERTQVVVKIHEPDSLLKRIEHVFHRGPLERAWGAARALDVRHIENPQALGLVVEHQWGVPTRSMLVTRYESESVPLREDLLDRLWPPISTPANGKLRDAIPAIADLVRRLHDSGVYHRDLNPMNVLVSHDRDGDRFSLVDLDSVKAGRLTDRRRRRNLVQLGLVPEGHISARDRLRFLKAYDRGEGRYWNREWIRALDEELAAETVRIIARMSRQERNGRRPDDPRFR